MKYFRKWVIRYRKNPWEKGTNKNNNRKKAKQKKISGPLIMQKYA